MDAPQRAGEVSIPSGCVLVVTTDDVRNMYHAEAGSAARRTCGRETTGMVSARLGSPKGRMARVRRAKAAGW